MALQAGDMAPDFTLPRDGGQTLSLAGLKGRKVVLYAYPKDDTPGCTQEAIAFNGLRKEFAAADTEIVGISPDAVKSHDKFSKKHGLDFALQPQTRQQGDASRPMASGSRRACTERPIWAWSGPPS